MKTIIYTITALLWSITMHAQENIIQIDQGKNYTQSVFLDLATKKTTTVDYTTWDIAFATGARNVSVLINEAIQSGADGRSIYLFSTSSKDFSNIDTLQIQDTLSNGDKALAAGAFNAVKDTSNAFDFGWGLYNPATHIVTGTRNFILKLRDGNYKKIRINQYNSQKYTFTYADLDGGNKVTDSITVGDYDGKSLAYYSIKNEKSLDLEPEEWDLKFTRYSTPLEAAPGEYLNYIVLGVLTRPGVEVVKATGIDPASVEYDETYADSLTSDADAIGHDWKFFDRNTFQYSIVPEQVYFVKTTNNEIYKIQFWDFEGSSTGITTLKVTLAEIETSSKRPEYITSTTLFPNPVRNQFSVNFQSHKLVKNAQLRIQDVIGRSVYTRDVDISHGANHIPVLNTLQAGMYYLSLDTGDGLIMIPFIKQ